MAASNRLMTKLNDALEAKAYYEAHQLLKTLNFRYISSKKYSELEELLSKSSAFFLDNYQFESGSDVAIMLSKLYATGELPVTETRIATSVSLLQKIPGGPDRATFISGIMDWCADSELSTKLHAAAAKVYIKEECFSDSWRHIMRTTDAQESANLVLLLASSAKIRSDEFDLVTANLCLTFLASKRVFQAEQCLRLVLQNSPIHHVTPLLNGVRFLIESVKNKNEEHFSTIKELYAPSFARDPRLLKLVGNVAKSVFNVSDQRGGQGLMPMLLNAFMGPQPSASSTQSQQPRPRQYAEPLD